MTYTIRKILPSDNGKIEGIIRSCLIEYGGDHEGTAWTDPDLGRFSKVYSVEGRCYFVAVRDDGRVVEGAGIGEIAGVLSVCELQKMYCIPEARGTGCAQMLLDAALDFAKKLYGECYLETLPNMTRARRFYEKNGFVRTDEILCTGEHFACDVRYIKNST